MPELVDLNSLIEGMTDLVEISLKPDVTLDVSLPTASLFVRVDPGQLESALFNLLLNANNAIPESGQIKVSLSSHGADQACILIEDNGVGMTDEVLTHAIEPFFTTRAGQGGTGLGLSIVYGFIRQTGGNLNITSQLNRGTLIEVQLPLARPLDEESRFAPPKTSLLVEDDPKTREKVSGMLKNMGLEVTICNSGIDALERLHSSHFDLLLSDLDLGDDIGGLKLVEVAKQRIPEVRTIIMSGKSSGRNAVPEHTEFVEKPMTPEKLANALELVRRASDLPMSKH